MRKITIRRLAVVAVVAAAFLVTVAPPARAQTPFYFGAQLTGHRLAELNQNGARTLPLPTGETRLFLEDGDEVIFRAHCRKSGHAAIGFGSCVGIVAPALK